MINRLIKDFEFIARERMRIVFSDVAKVRLNDDNKLDQGITLKADADGLFDIGLTNTALTWSVAPKALKKWVGFDADIVAPENTSVGFRLLRLSDELYWDGAAWVAATTDAHWNTLAQVSTNIKDLVLTSFDLKVKMNLRTTDPNVSPKIRWIKLLAKVDFDNWDDLIYDTLVRTLRTQLRPTTVLEAEVAATTDTFDLATTYKVENSGYNFVGIKAAYNITDDPNKFINLALSYTAGAVKADGNTEPGQVQLTAPVDAGKIIRLELEYSPTVAVHTDQDYSVAQVPMLAFENISTQRVNGKHDQELSNAEGDFVRDLVTNMAVEVFRPRQSTVRFEFVIHASPLDMASLVDAVDKWVSNTPLLSTWGMDEQVNVDAVSEIDTSRSENMESVVMASGVFQLRGVPFYMRESKDVPLIKKLNVTLT